MYEKTTTPTDAERQRDLTIAETNRQRDELKAKLAERKAINDAAEQPLPRREYELKRDCILADKACSERIADAWRKFFDLRLTDLDQAFAALDRIVKEARSDDDVAKAVATFAEHVRSLGS